MRGISAFSGNRVEAFQGHSALCVAHVCNFRALRGVRPSVQVRRRACCQAGSDPSKPTSSKPKLGDKEIDVTVYRPDGAKQTEKRKVKIDKVEAAAIQQQNIAASEQSQALRRNQAQGAVDRTARNVEEGVDQTADAAQEGISQLSEGFQEGAEQLQQGADDLADQAADVAQNFEQNLEQAADSAADKAANFVSQAQAAAQEFADSANSFVSGLEKGAQSGSPYQDQQLTSMEADPYTGAAGRKPTAENQASYFKLRLLQCIAGLDRGFSASPSAAAQIESATLSLTEQSGPVSLSWTPAQGQEEQDSGLAQLSGTWRLVYSSGFASGRYGSQQAGTPGRLGQVFQVISPYTSRLENVLELFTGLPGLPPVIFTVSIKHHFEALGGNIVQITVEDTEVKVTGGIGGLLGNLPELIVPQLPEPFRPSRQQRTSTFDVLYLDDNVRITRGSRGELRIFVKT